MKARKRIRIQVLKEEMSKPGKGCQCSLFVLHWQSISERAEGQYIFRLPLTTTINCMAITIESNNVNLWK